MFSHKTLGVELNRCSEDFIHAITHRTLPFFPLIPRRPALSNAQYKTISQRVNSDLRFLASELQRSHYSLLLYPIQLRTYKELASVMAFRESCLG